MGGDFGSFKKALEQSDSIFELKDFRVVNSNWTGRTLDLIPNYLVPPLVVGPANDEMFEFFTCVHTRLYGQPFPASCALNV